MPNLYNFCHEEFYFYFLGKVIAKSLLQKDNQYQIRKLLDKKTLPELTVEEIVHKVKLSSNNEYVIQQLKSIISIGIRNSCLSQNIGSILMRLINNQSNQCVVTGIYSTASSIAGISLENIIFENCIFEKIDISKKMIKNIIFKNCDIFELLCDTDSLNDKISISFDEKSIPRTLLFLQKSNDITYIYSPTEIKNIVSNLSSEHKTGKLNIIEEDKEVILFYKMVNYFLQKTGINENLLMTKMGVNWSFFQKNVLEPMLDIRIVVETEYRGQDRQKRYKLNASLAALSEARKSCDGKFKHLLQLLGGKKNI